MLYTSYYAVIGKLPKDVVTVSISRGIPSWYHGKSYSKLAPKWETVERYKNGGLWDWYITEYYDTVLNWLSPEKVYKDLMELSEGKDVVLLCYEKSGSNCHRNLVADWFNSADIQCSEYNFQCSPKDSIVGEAATDEEAKRMINFITCSAASLMNGENQDAGKDMNYVES